MSSIFNRLVDAANQLFGILGPANGGTGVANNAAATFTRSGNHGLTVTTTDTTSVTLPTSGTLVASGAIVDADINASAAITGSKIVSASASVSGVVNTTTQTFAGSKTLAAATTIGAVVTGNINGSSHTLNGGVAAGNVTSTDQSGYMQIGVNARVSGTGHAAARTDTTTTGAALFLSNRTSGTAETWAFYCNAAGAATTNNGFASLSGDAGGNLYAPNLGSGAGTNAVKWNSSGGKFTFETSNSKFKHDIRDSSYGLAEVLRLRSVQFAYNDTKSQDVGFLAEEVAEVLPELCPMMLESRLFEGGANKLVPSTVSYDRLTSVLVKAVQELSSQLDGLRAELAACKSKEAK